MLCMVSFKDKLTSALILALLITQGASPALANTLAQNFTYQGRFLTPDGSSPMTDIVDITIGIYNPTATCLLYEEKHSNIDLSASAGMFSVRIGTGTRVPVRDPGLTIPFIFRNTTASALRA